MATLLVGQSGGPTSVINSSLVGVVRQAQKENKVNKVLGAHFGIDGVLNEDFFDLTNISNDELTNWSKTPASILGSVRLKLPQVDSSLEIYQNILNVFKKYDIKYFFYIGGNDSMDTCMKLDLFFKEAGYECYVIGVPKTIDNDLVLTDHCPGYGSAAKYVATTLTEIALDTDVYKKGRVTIVEIMGRDAGWLTAASHLANINGDVVQLIYLPEVAFNMDEFLRDVERIYKEKKKVLVAISEGIRDKDGKYILEYQGTTESDKFGHMQLGGVGQVLAGIVNQKLGISTRAIELSLPQRCAAHLGSLTDVKEAEKAGSWAVKYAVNGKSGMMVAYKRVSDYKIVYKTAKLTDVANQVKEFPREWIINGNSISNEYLTYALPLIKGESYPKYSNGLPSYSRLK